MTLEKCSRGALRAIKGACSRKAPTAPREGGSEQLQCIILTRRWAIHSALAWEMPSKSQRPSRGRVMAASGMAGIQTRRGRRPVANGRGKAIGL